MVCGVLMSMAVIGCSVPGGTAVSHTPKPFTQDGRFGADSVECPWIQGLSGEKGYLILPSRFEVRLHPTRLLSDGAVVANQGSLIRVSGREASGGATLCAASPPLPVDNVVVLGDAGS